MKTVKSAIYIAAIILVAGCSGTAIISTWKALDITPQKFNRIMVVAIGPDANRTLREHMEEHLAGDLKDLGYNTSSAYNVYGPKEFENMTETSTNDKLAKDGYDAVLTVVLLDKQRERYYVPARVVYSPYITYQSRFWGYYRTMHTRIISPGYYASSTKYFWESNFYDLASGKLLYSVQTESFDPVSADKLAHEYGGKIVQDMVKNSVLQKQATP